MLVQARQARTANNYAPLLQKKSFAAGQIRWYYGPWLYLWVDAARDPRATGVVVPTTPDQSGKNVSITQPTASKQPLKATGGNVVSAFLFDGVNDCLDVAAIDLTTTQAVTIADARYKNTNTFGFIYEYSTNSSLVTTGWYVNNNENSIAGQDSWYMKGNVGDDFRQLSSPPAGSGTPISTWVGYTVVLNKAAASGSEMAIYKNGSVVTSFANILNADNTNFFGNLTSFVGARNDGTAVAANAYIAQLVVLNTALSTENAALLSLLVSQAAGIP